MKSLVFALLLSVALCSTEPSVTITGAPVATSDSCDTSQYVYFFWLPASREGFTVDTKFQLQLSQPTVYADCTVCADSKGTADYCGYITCVVDVASYKLIQATVELPASLDTSGLDFVLDGWEKNISPNPVVATNVYCKSGFLKMGALLLVALLLF